MTTIIYFSNSTVLFAILYMFYCLVLKQLTFHSLNRYYLIVSAMLAFLLPMIQLSSAEFISTTTLLPEITLGKIAGDGSIILFDEFYWIKFFYFLGLILASALSVSRIFWLGKVLLKSKQSERRGIRILQGDFTNSFSFFGTIYLAENLTEEERTYIVQHESVHIQQYHTIDLILFEILSVVFWFNPLYRLAKRHLMATHEFIADEKAVGNDPQRYKQILVARAFRVPQSVFNSFSQTNFLKRRLIMLAEKKSTVVKKWRYVLIIPMAVCALSVQSFGFNFEKSTKETLDSEKSPVKLGDEVAKQAEYKGGMEALSKFIGSNLIYPEKAKSNNIAGKVYVEFVVTDKGKVTDVKIKKGVDQLLDEEAVRVIKLMPDWNAAVSKSGKSLNSTMVLPINFAL